MPAAHAPTMRRLACAVIASAVMVGLVPARALPARVQGADAVVLISRDPLRLAEDGVAPALDWLAGQPPQAAPMIYALSFLFLFAIGGLTGLFLGSLSTDIHLHDTYFVVAHFHYIMVGGAIMGYLGGLHFWWPKIFGRMYPVFWSKLSALLVFVGFNLTFFPQFVLGYLGMPRRYHAYPEEFQVLNVMSSAAFVPRFMILTSYSTSSPTGTGPLGSFSWSFRSASASTRAQGAPDCSRRIASATPSAILPCRPAT